MASNQNNKLFASTASILVLTAGMLNPDFAQAMMTAIQAQEATNQDSARARKKLVTAIHEQNKFSQQQFYAHTPKSKHQHPSQAPFSRVRHPK